MKDNENLKEEIELKAIIFDMDGVVTDTMPFHYKAWKYVFGLHGIHLSKQDIYEREGQKGIDSLDEIFAKYKKTFNKLIGQNLLKSKETYFKKIFKLRYISGSRSLLKQCVTKKFKLALVTGTSRDEVIRLLPKKIFNLFDVTVCGSDVRIGKPHPEPYLKALKGLSLKAKDCVVIENAPYGIRSAKAAGIKCVAIATSLPESYLQQADYVFSSISSLKKNINFKNDE